MTCCARADYLAITLPLTPATRGLIGEGALRRMKATAFLINVARGEIVDEDALYQALAEKRIAGAALDVWYRYPTGAAPTLPARPSLPRAAERAHDAARLRLDRWDAAGAGKAHRREHRTHRARRVAGQSHRPRMNDVHLAIPRLATRLPFFYGWVIVARRRS